jgi:hypothetical protein
VYTLPSHTPLITNHTQELKSQLLVLLSKVQRRRGADQPPWPVLSLKSSRLPCMPTLNGWLLGYPVIYLVGSYQAAASASRQLSAAQLRRFSLRLACAALGPLAGGEAGGAAAADVLLSFTVPAELHTPALDAAVSALVGFVAGLSIEGEGTGLFPAGAWSGPPTLCVETVGPGAVSL